MMVTIELNRKTDLPELVKVLMLTGLWDLTLPIFDVSVLLGMWFTHFGRSARIFILYMSTLRLISLYPSIERTRGTKQVMMV
jgi:hypothetical protein